MGNRFTVPEFDHAARIDTFRCVRLRKETGGDDDEVDGTIYEVVVTTPSPSDDDAIQWRVTCVACDNVTFYKETRQYDWYFGLITKECGDRQRVNGTIRAVQYAQHTFSIRLERCNNDARLDYKIELVT